MSGILNSGKLATLLSRLTATRAGYLDAAISSRASGTDYTTARAAKLDYLDAAISSVASSNEIPGTLVAGVTAIDFDPGTAGSPKTKFENAGLYAYSMPTATTTILSVSGEGYIDFLAAYNISAGSTSGSVTLTVDGSIVWTSAASCATYEGFNPVGSLVMDSSGNISSVAFSRIRFSTGFSLASSSSSFKWDYAAKYFTV